MPKTTEASLTDLLDRWVELEPAKCEADTYDDPDGLGYFLLPQMKENQSWIPKPVTSGWNQAEVQAAVQKSIEDRGWFSDQIQDGGKYVAEVSWTTTYGSAEATASPAHALLAAYLTALESQTE